MLQPFRDAALLGAVQGVTEFLPVSSDGHLALAELLFEPSDGGLTFNVMLHAGTLLATLFVLRGRVVALLVAFARGLSNPSLFRTTTAGRDAVCVVVASVPTAIIGLSLRNAVATWTSSPWAIGLGFSATSLVVLSTFWVRPGRLEQPTVLSALAIGFMQGLAVLPGLSRSGGTIATALWLGVRPERAFELSFLMSLPAVAGAILLESRHVVGESFPVGPALVGAAAALVTGGLALGALRHVVQSGRFFLFALWTLPLAVATLAMAAMWPR